MAGSGPKLSPSVLASSNKHGACFNSMACWNKKKVLSVMYSGVVKVELQLKQHLFTQVFR